MLNKMVLNLFHFKFIYLRNVLISTEVSNEINVMFIVNYMYYNFINLPLSV